MLLIVKHSRPQREIVRDSIAGTLEGGTQLKTDTWLIRFQLSYLLTGFVLT